MKDNKSILLVIGFAFIFPLLLYIIIYSVPKGWNFDIYSLIVKWNLNAYTINNTKYIIYILAICILSFAVYTVNFVLKNKLSIFLKRIVRLIPNKINSIIRNNLLRIVPNKEKCYSLFYDYDSIKIENISDKFAHKHLSLNGLVGTMNQEDKGMEVTNEQINSFLDSVLEHIRTIEYGDKHLLESEKQLNNYLNIFSVENIKKSIDAIVEETSKVNNTFKFISDQYGIYNIYKKNGQLTLEIYETTHFTFKVMNHLYKSNLNVLEPLALRFCSNYNDKLVLREGFRLLFPFFASFGLNIIIEMISKQRGKCFLIQKRSAKVYGNVSQYHISVNETFSFTDINSETQKPSLLSCVRRGIEEELGLKIDNKNIEQDVRYLDLFFNPKRGNLGLSLVYCSKENPSYITYYPGVDKVLESTKHICVYDINNYNHMKNFISLFNWVVYTPYILQRYAIYRQSQWGTIMTALKYNKLLFLSIILYYLSVVSSIFILFYFYLTNGSIIAGVLILSVMEVLLNTLKEYLNNRKDIRNIKKVNIDKESLGAYPYNDDVIMYTGQLGIRVDMIVFAINNHFLIKKKELFNRLNSICNFDISECITYIKIKQPQIPKDICWNSIKIHDYDAGIRHVFLNSEFPSLILKGSTFLSNNKNTFKELIVREFLVIESGNTCRIGYNLTESNKLIFGYNHTFDDVFDLNKEYSCISTHAKKILMKQGYKEFISLKVKGEIGIINLYDIYKSKHKDCNSIVISATMQNSSLTKFQNIIEGNKDEISDKINKLMDEYETNDKDLLMLQQILIRRNVYLFKNK